MLKKSQAVCAISVLMASGSAYAQSKFDIRITGDYYMEAGYIDQDNDSGLRSTEFRNRMRFNIIPSAKADNGLEYGARMRIRASNGDRTMDADRSFIFLQGAFGRFDLGTRNSWHDDTFGSFSRPVDFHFLGIYDAAVTWATSNNASAGNTKLDVSTFAYMPAATSTTQGAALSDVATKAMYISPKFSGFQASLAFTPHATSSATDVNRLTGPTGAGAGTLQNVWEAGVNYSGEFSGVGVRFNAGYLGGKYENTGAVAYEDLNGVTVGAQVGYAGFVLGGGYLGYGKSGLAKNAAFKDNYEAWNVGLQYTTGAFVLGAGYTYGQDAGDVRVAGKREQDYYTAGVAYQMAPGLRLGLEYSLIEAKNKDVTALAAERKVDSNVVIARTVLVF